MPNQNHIPEEVAQAIAAGMPRCPNCGGQNVRPSLAIRLEDKLRGFFQYIPYRCRSCQHRFYKRPKPHATSTEPRMDTDAHG